MRSLAPNERYRLVPTALRENLRFRRDLLARCAKSKPLQRTIIEVCKHDPLFFFNVFCWCYEPRPRFLNGVRLANQIPFIAWEHQAPAILLIHEHLGTCDIGVEKSRGEGMSWIGILLAMHDWLFHPMTAIGLVSKDEIAVDDANDPDSLMWKMDFTLKKLPVWMAGVRDKDWKRDVSKHTLRNLRNESTISGYAATEDVASGGRKKWFLKDELAKFPKPADKAAMASTQHVTECRVIVSTPKGSSGAYFDAMHEPSNMIKVRLHWSQNPVRNRGLYEWKDGRPVAADPVGNPLLPGYDPPSQDVLDLISRLRRKGFKVEGKLRSAWYDRECDRTGATPQNIAQELDLDYGGSAFRVFGDTFLSKIDGTTITHCAEGDLNFKSEKIDHIRFDRIDGGPMKLWVPLDSLGNPPPGHYVIGCDISAGTGGSYTSNSTIDVFDLMKGEQVLEYACNTIVPVDFADLSIAVAKWFWEAFLGWEHNGPGSGYTRQVLKRQYGNIYYRKSLSRRAAESTKEAGWWTDDRTKEVMFADFQSAVIANEVIIRSRQLYQECGQYIRKEGKIHHALTKNAADDSRGASHGDRVISSCVAVQAMRERPMLAFENDYQHVAPPGTMAARMREYDDADRRSADDWDHGMFGSVA